jgi:hypothetical protein
MEIKIVDNITAKLAKQAGFSEKCYWYSCPQGKIGNDTKQDWNSLVIPYKHTSLPSQALLQKWLREKHQIDVEVWRYYNKGYYFSIDGHTDTSKQSLYLTYEHCLEGGLRKGLNKILKQ